MFWIDLVLALLIGVLLTSVFLLPYRKRRAWDWGLFATFFLILFLAAWAGGVWVRPFGPTVGGVYWLPSLFVGVIIALLLVTLLPARGGHRRSGTEEAGVEAPPGIVFGTFVWVLLLLLVVVVAAGYLV